MNIVFNDLESRRLVRIITLSLAQKLAVADVPGTRASLTGLRTGRKGISEMLQ